jgi:hypothetical protein
LSLRLNHAAYDPATNDFERTASTETAYAGGLARVIFAPGPPSTGSGPHVFLEFGDYLGSTTAVVEKGTGELAEYATYLAYGSVNSDFRAADWNSFREDMRFTGRKKMSK